MGNKKKFSKNSKINLVIENILDELCPFLEEQAREISEMTTIGKALGTGKDISTLLEMILSIARRLSKADGGTLYLVDRYERELEFRVLQNESLNLREQGTSINLPPVQLYGDDGAPNLSNVSSYVFHTGSTVNIKNVYRTKKFHFDGFKKFDQALNYKSRSMLVFPMRNHENNIIGILQLINAMDPKTGKIISFNTEDQEKASAMASQAAVILTQQTLILEMKELFEAFIKAIAVSIDEKSKHTGGHIQRVTTLAIMIAGAINEDKTYFKDIRFTHEQIDELRIAALLHDTGKITTPDHIIGKSARLETVFDRIELLRTRWELFIANCRLSAANQKLELMDIRDKKDVFDQIDSGCNKKIKALEKEFEILNRINSSKTGLDKHQIKELNRIKTKSMTISGRAVPYLTEDEIKNLSIEQGTLTDTERKTINGHASLTEKILNKLPWPKKLANIPMIAGAHHEKLDGSGYPLGRKENELGIQARVLAIADIFEALSAQDRPYKEPMPLSQTIAVLKELGERNQIDGNIVNLFLESNTHLEYARHHLAPSQIDI